MRALDHSHGLHVAAFDADRGSAANVGRQPYSASDVGRHKALVTVHRLNQAYGLDWDARPLRYEEVQQLAGRSSVCDLLTGCAHAGPAPRRSQVAARSVEPILRASGWPDMARAGGRFCPPWRSSTSR
jgi:hypothetical protein